MAFGQELKDFVSGFQTGASIKGARQDRKFRKEEAEQRRKEREEDREYRSQRDMRRDFESDRDYDFRQDQFGWQMDQFEVANERWLQDFGLRSDQFKLDRAKTIGDSTLPGWDERSGQGSGVDTNTPTRAIPEQEDGDTPELDTSYAVPEGPETVRMPSPVPGSVSNAMASATGSYSGGSGAGAGGMQLASYAPTEQSASAAAETVSSFFNPDTYFPKIRSQESSGDDRARNPRSTATGRYQFLRDTWAGLAQKYPELGLTPNGRTDPKQQERAIRAFTKDNIQSLQKAGIPITNGTVYAAHFLGDGGARKVLRSNPRTPIGNLVGADVMRANPHLRGMTVKDFVHWAERVGGGPLAKYARRASKGGLIQSFASGGLVGALAVDEEEDDLPMALPDEAPVQVADASGAIPLPDEAPIPDSRPAYDGAEEGTPSEPPPRNPREARRRAVRDGLITAIRNAGADRGGAIDDPELEAVRQRYLKGYGSTTPQMMREVLDKIDPNKEMSTSERNMHAIGTVYQYFVENGQLDRAQEAAASMVQFYRMSSNQFLALGQAAMQEGDLDSATKALVSAYANIPNGRDLKVVKKGEGYEVSVTDDETGEVVAKQVMSPRDMAAAVMQMNPGTFDDEILAAAGAKVEIERSSESNLRERGQAIDDLLADTETMGEDFNPDWAAPIAGVAKSIASHTDNNFDDMTSVQMATELWRAWRDTGEGAEPMFRQKSVPGTGGKTVEVTLEDGTSFQVDKSFLTRMQNAVEKEMAGRRKTDTGAGEEFKKGADAAVEHFTAPPPNEPNPDIIREGERPMSDRLSEPRVAPGSPVKLWADEPAIPENETELEGLLRRREEIRQRNDPRLRGVLNQIEKRIKQLEGR